VSLGINKIDTTTYIWAACRPGGGDAGQKYAVAYSTNYGHTWAIALGKPAWDIAFSGDTVLIAFGDYILPDYGYGLAMMVRNPSTGLYGDLHIIDEDLVDSTGNNKYLNSPFYTVDIVNGQIWAGGAEGAVRSANGGQSWSIYRSELYPEDHYAYPSPFSPYVTEREGTTIHYKMPETANVTIKIYDFNLDLVKTVIDGISRADGRECDVDIWDGRNERGDVVANGVYFYNIKLSTGQSWWGKVAMIK